METLRLGFTGTREGMTANQFLTCMHWIQTWRQDITIYFHFGDCVGSDAQMFKMVKLLNRNIITVCHPPIKDALRAFCRADIIKAPLPYLERDRNIVDQTEILLATPKDENQKGGTWYTINYARTKHEKDPIVVLPNGSLFAIV